MKCLQSSKETIFNNNIPEFLMNQFILVCNIVATVVRSVVE